MAVTETTRFGFKKYSASTDPHPNRTEFNALMDKHELLSTMGGHGTTAARPAAGKGNRVYWDNDAGRFYYDNGVEWKEVAGVGGGGAGAALAVGGPGTEGVSTRGARADHTHPLPLATDLIAGAMSAADKARLDTATALGTASALVMRDANGRAQFGAPSALADAATKGYVDSQVATKTNLTIGNTATTAKAGNWLPAWNNIQSLPDYFPPSSSSGSGVEGLLVQRDASGMFGVRTPTAASHPATKAYVDGKTWAANDVTSGVFSNDRLKNITGGDTWLALSSGRGAIRIATDGTHYIQHDDNTIISWSASGTLMNGNIPAARITGTVGNDQIGTLRGDKIVTDIPHNVIVGTDQVHQRSVSGGGTYYAVWVDGGGRFGRNTSSRRFKENIRPYAFDPEKVLALQPVEYDRKGGGAHEFGLIAEDTEPLVPEIVTWFEGKIDSVRYDLLAVAQQSVIQKHEAEIAELRQAVDELKALLK